MRSKLGKHAYWTSSVSPVAPTPSTGASWSSPTTATPRGAAETLAPIQAVYKRGSRTGGSNPSGVSGVPELAAHRHSPEVTSGGYSRVDFELRGFRQEIALLKADAARAQEILSDLQNGAETRLEKEADFSLQLWEIRKELNASTAGWKEEAGRLTSEIAARHLRQTGDLQTGLVGLNQKIQEQLEVLDASLAHQKLVASKDNTVIESKIERECFKIKSAMAEQTTREHLENIKRLKTFEDSIGILEQTMSSDRNNVDSDKKKLRKQQTSALQDVNESFKNALKDDLAQLTADFAERLESCKGSLSSNLEECRTALQTSLLQECNERCKAHVDLQNSIALQAQSTTTSICDLDSKLIAEVQQMSDTRRQDKIDLQNSVRNCLSLILPTKSSELNQDGFPRDEVEYPGSWTL